MQQLSFAPRIGYGDREERLAMRLSDADLKKTGRGQRWQAVVTDLNTGQNYLARSASCGSPGCYCDAVATNLPTGKVGRKPTLLEAAKIALSLLQQLQSDFEDEITTKGTLRWPEIDALSVAIRLEEGKRARQRKVRS